ncbi:hypothetical protein M8J77_022987 [Diaphorina citri]|nr:hypothetical protein M8J77_022987 [Diaphorina citri]
MSSAEDRNQTAQMSMQGTVFTIDLFSDNLNWTRWVQRLEAAFRIFNITDNVKQRDYLLHYMGSKTFDLLCDKLSPENPTDKTYSQIVDILKRHFSPEPLEIVENFRFHKRVQTDGESVKDFFTSLQKLSTTCKFGPYLDTALRNQFVFGLRDQTIQSRLLEVENLTVKSAFDKAYSMELCASSATEIQKGNASSNEVITKLQVKHGGISGGGDVSTKVKKTTVGTALPGRRTACYRCGSPDHFADKCKVKSKFCKFCKRRGHLDTVCLKKVGNPVLNIGETSDTSDTDLDEVVGNVESLHHSSDLHEDTDRNTSQDTCDIHTMTSSKTRRTKIHVVLNTNSQDVKYEIDTGASISVMGLKYFRSIFPKTELKETDLILVSYCNTKVKVLGVVNVKVTYNNITKYLNLYIVNLDKDPIVGREWLYEIPLDWAEIWRDNNYVQNIDTESGNVDKRVKELLSRYPIITAEGVGKMNHIQARLTLRPNSKPVFCKARKPPFALLPKIEEELENLVEQGILVKVNSSEWATPIVPVMKPNGAVRICGDFKVTLNKHLQVDDHPLPTIDELFSSLAGGEKFSKMDLSQAYLHMPIHDEDTHLLTLNTHKGLFMPTRLMFGISPAPAIWQREIEKVIKGIPGVGVYLDDMYVTGPDDATHLDRLKQVFERLNEYNLRLNVKKSVFLQSELEYCGYIICKAGIKKTKGKIEAIQSMKQPTNKSEVRAILGLINYYGRFFKNLSALLYPLNRLLQDRVPFEWNSDCEKAFKLVKSRIQSDDVLCHFDPKLPITVASDSSSYAVGAVISHIFPDGTERPIQFASQTLTKTQQKYSQIDKEAYAIIFAIKKFFQYLYGRRFVLICDHKPLVQIFNPDKSIPVMSATRMQHYALFLQGFSYDIRYRNTKQHGNADAMSRLPLRSEDTHMFDETDILQIQNIETLPLTVQDIATHTKSDKCLQPLLSGLQTGELIDSHLRFHINQDEFSLQSGCIMRGIRVVVPKTLQSQVLQELHAAHFGISKMKSLARGYCWWYKIDTDIEELAKNCSDCNQVANNPVKVPTHPWEPPAFPFDRIHVDFAGPFYNNYHFLIVVDAFTKWPEIFKVKNMTSDTTIKLLRCTFARFGIPTTLVSDNATTFTSDSFKKFLKKNNVIHKTIAPYHPATNGQAERYVQILKNALIAMKNEGDIDVQLARLLLQYRKTPQTSTNVSPSVLMFGREIRSKLDMIKPNIYAKVDKAGSNSKPVGTPREIALNKRVAVRNYTSKNKWEFGTVMRKLGKLHYEVKLDDGRVWKRHIDQIREVGDNTAREQNHNYPVIPVSPAPDTLPHHYDVTLPGPSHLPSTPGPSHSSSPTHSTDSTFEPTDTTLNSSVFSDPTPTSEVRPTSADSQTQDPVPIPEPRRSTRDRRPPNWFSASDWW